MVRHKKIGLLEELPENITVKACYLVGSFKDDLSWDALSQFFLKPFDFEKIKRKSRLWYFIHSDNDPYCPLEHAHYLHQQIGGDLLILPGQKHFSVESFGEKYRQFPYLFRLIAEDTFTAENVKDIFTNMEQKGIQLWLDGGWGVDALLGRQTRPHGDIDIVIEKKDVATVVEYLKNKGYWQILRSDTTPQNFLMGNSEAQFVDFHVIALDENGNGVYGPQEDGVLYTAEALSGVGVVGGKTVKCISPEWVVRFHSGYVLREKDHHDVLAICEKFAIQVPEQYKS